MRIYDSNEASSSVYIFDQKVSYASLIHEHVAADSFCYCLDEHDDPISRIISAAFERNATSIHIVSHGKPGCAVLSSGFLDAESLRARADDLSLLRSRAGQTEILLYGCEIGAASAGLAFVQLLSELTGLPVAASSSLTGTKTLGGNWELDVRTGPICARPLCVPDYPAVLTAPSLNGLQPVRLNEGDTVSVAPSLSVSGGSSYNGGAITFQVGAARASDQLSLMSDSDPTLPDAVTVVDGVVYYGAGSARVQVGVVDAVENGQNGQPLTIRFVRAFENAGFESGTSGWTVGTDHVVLGTTLINGILTPTDTTIAPNSGDDAGANSAMSFFSQLSTAQHTEGTQSLRLFNSGTTDAGFDVVHGPYAYSSTFAAVSGDTFTFDWSASSGNDAFDVFGYLMKADGSESVTVIDATGTSSSGNQPWTEVTVSVPSDGEWFFVFVAGTYDFSGGRAAGGSLYIDNFRVGISGLADTVIAAIAQNVTYGPAIADAAPRSVSVSVTDSAGDVQTTTASLNVNDQPAGALRIAGTAARTEVLSVVNEVQDADGLGTPSYHWQRLGQDGTWRDITGAIASTYQLTSADVGLKVRAVLDYVDAGGTAETVIGVATGPVAAFNFAPVAAPDTFSVALEDGPITLDLLANDSDGDGDTLRVAQIDGHDLVAGGLIALDSGTVSLGQDGRIIFTPFLTHSGTVSFDYTVGDSAGGVSHGSVTGEVTASSGWQASVTPLLTEAIHALGLGADFDINALLAIASVVAPGALFTSDTALRTGYQPMPGTDLRVQDLAPDASQLVSTLLSVRLAQSATEQVLAVADSDGRWHSSADQSLLFQTTLADTGTVGIDYGTSEVGHQDTPSSGWSRAIALQSLRSDFSEDTVRQWDQVSQGRLLQDTLGMGDQIAVRFDDQSAATPQSALTTGMGLLDFTNTDASSAVTVARPVAIVQTMGDADDQVAVVQTRQNGMNDLSLMLYRVDDLTGMIDGISAGDAGYAAAAAARAYQTEGGSTAIAGAGYGKYAESRMVGIDDGDIIAMRLTTSAGGEFYSFTPANSDGDVTHLWNYGLNTWGWEDIAGGGDHDFNDLVVRLDFVSASLDEISG